MEEKAKNPVLKAALIYGGIFGFVTILLSVILDVLGLTFEKWVSFINLPVGIALVLYAQITYKKEYLGGFAKYEQLMLMTLLMSLFATVLTTLYSFINMTWIDPDFIDKLKNVQYEAMLNNPRIPEEAIDESMDMMEKFQSPALLLLFGFLGGYVRIVIIGVITAAFVKKNNPAEIAA